MSIYRRTRKVRKPATALTLRHILPEFRSSLPENEVVKWCSDTAKQEFRSKFAFFKCDGRAKTSGGDFEVRRIIRQVLRDHGGRLFEWWHDVFRGINKAPD